MNNDKKNTLGLDIGGSSIKAIALEANQILEEREFPSHSQVGPEAVRKAIATTVNYFKDKGLTIGAIGIGCAGSVAPVTGVVRNSPNFSSWENVPLKDWVKEDFKLPVTVDNDANCAVYTEWKLGAGKEFSNVVLLTLGTGIGGGLIINKKLFRGATGTAGELGHFSIHTDGVDCACGNRGCFERYCSASALEAKFPGMTAKEIFEKNDPKTQKAVDDFFYDFRIGLTSLANMFDPDAFVFTGGMSEGFVPRLPEIEAWLKEHAFPAVGPHVKLLLAKYGTITGALGAALIAQDET
jgi:glucokinase